MDIRDQQILNVLETYKLTNVEVLEGEDLKELDELIEYQKSKLNK